MLNRQLTDFGLHPFVGYLLVAVVFYGLSTYLFLKTELAAYIYASIALSLTFQLSEAGRNNFLKMCFSTGSYFRVRILENILTVIPFFVFLLTKSMFLQAFLLLTGAIAIVFLYFRSSLTFTIPTPFYKRPFEFIVGFRNTYYLLFFAYFITIMSVLSGNFNLGIFSLLFVLLLCLTFYTNQENSYFVWIFAMSSKSFLFHKLKTALLYSTLLCLPVITALCIFYPTNSWVAIGFAGLGIIYLLTVVLIKYSSYPNKMNLPQALIIALCVSFPPLLLGVIPFFYIKSIKRLNEILR